MPIRFYLVVVLLIASLIAQSPQPVRLVGTVQGVEANGLSLVTDQKETTAVAFDGKAKVQKVAPGEKDLSKAQQVEWMDLAAGDRVLVKGHRLGEVILAESVVLMSAREIARRNDDVKREWMTRSVAGLVERVNPSTGEITLLVRGAGGMQPVAVNASAAAFLRYALDSVRFADAQASAIADVKKGDQLRVLGEKTADGAKVKAEKILFGTFQSVAGTVGSVNLETGEIRLKDVQSGKTLLIRTKAESQIKRLPAMPGGFPGPPGAPPGGIMRPPGGPPDIGAMLERMPAAKLSDFQVGETIVASATAGGQPGELTAILILGNAGGLLARLTNAGGPSRGAAAGAGQGVGMGAGFGGLDAMMGMPNMQ